MPVLDNTAKAAVAGPGFAPAWFIWLDIGNDDLRVTNFAKPVTFAGTGDPDLDGNTFVPFGGALLDVGDVSNSDNGSEALDLTLSGIVSMDTTLINDMGDRTLWQGRLGRIWFQVYDPDGVTPQGALVPHYTGYMSKVTPKAAPDSQTIRLTLENYLAYTTQASNRDYLGQKDFDPNDTSAAATLAAANGLRRDTGAGGGAGVGPGTGGSLIGGPSPSNYPSLMGDLGGGSSYGTWGSDGFSTTALNSQ